MSEITPITREEKLWNGEDLEPLTREEMYIKRIFDKTQKIPDKPLTRKEILMEKAGEGGGGDVTIKQLSVTANGTYSEEGTAYSPVNVNVPLPENAYLLKTASGSLVSFSDGADLPMPSFICKIEAVQSGSGDPSPENVRPISGHTGVDAWVKGKNLANPATVTTLFPTGDSGTYPNQIRNSSNARSVIAEVTPNTTYTISKKAGQRFRLAFTEEEPANGVADMGYEWNDTGTTITVTSPSNAKYMVVLFWSSNVDTDTEEDMLATLQIEIGETATTYEPYNSNSQTIQVSWQTEAGEVFGGYVDLVSGVLTVTDGYIDLETCEWLRADLGNGNYRYYNTEISDVVKKPSSTSIMPNIECSHYKNKLPSQYNQAVDGITIYTNGSIQVYDSTKSALTTTDFKTAMDGVQLVYELATPITYQLTPTQIKSLLGNNNAWCDTGDVDIDYFARR